MQSPGPESWHPNPAFLFQDGAGPLFDIGPYYLTTLVQAFGSIRRVAATGSRARDTRMIGSGPLAGEEFRVSVPTHVSALTEFDGGQSSQSIFSFDSPLPRTGFVEITGTEATVSFPDPNEFHGDVRLYQHGAADWETIPAVGSVFSRGTGVLEMARAIRADRAHRAQGTTAFHILDAMVATAESIDTGEFVSVTSSAAALDPLPEDWDPAQPTLT